MTIQQNKNTYTPPKKKTMTYKQKHDAEITLNLTSQSKSRPNIPHKGLNKKSQSILESRRQTNQISTLKNAPNPHQSLLSFEKEMKRNKNTRDKLLCNKQNRKRKKIENAPCYNVIREEMKRNKAPTNNEPPRKRSRRNIKPSQAMTDFNNKKHIYNKLDDFYL